VSYVIAAYAVSLGTLSAYAWSVAREARRLREEISGNVQNAG
jgi:hypothetical protein